jgi:hypothetical protein
MDNKRLHTLLFFRLIVFVAAIVERYRDSELCLGNICGGVSYGQETLRTAALPVISSGKIDSSTSRSSFWSSIPIV